jgi:hypothetical protein
MFVLVTLTGCLKSDTKLTLTLMLAIIGIILIVLWALGLGFHIAGGLIHIILVVAVIMFVFHLLTGRRA